MVNRHLTESPQWTRSLRRRLMGVLLMALMLSFLIVIAAKHLKSQVLETAVRSHSYPTTR
jgi:hypothetical protein